MLECMTAKGAAALNIIPDRNWNIADPERAARKIAQPATRSWPRPTRFGAADQHRHGDEQASACRSWTIWTARRCGRTGGVPARGADHGRAHAAAALRGLLVRRAGGGGRVPGRRTRGTTFFERVGALPPLTAPAAERLNRLGPERALAAMRDAAATGRWPGA